MEEQVRIIDAWVNPELPRNPQRWQREVAESFFKQPAEAVFRKFSAEELIERMDEAGVEKAVLTLHADRPSAAVLGYAERYPDRFATSILVDPRRGMKATRQLQALVAAHGVLLARVIPSLCNLPPDDRIYYPLYAKCVELALPISINTGIPGPLVPARCQDPIHVDEVCLFFPELKVIMANGADPWWEVAIRLMTKHANLYLMTSAFAPKYLPPCLLHFMNTRGGEKVMFASDFPFLTMERCTAEAKALDLREEARANYLYHNAARVLFRAAASPSLQASVGATASDAATPVAVDADTRPAVAFPPSCHV
jgi:uncharacterized protein